MFIRSRLENPLEFFYMIDDVKVDIVRHPPELIHAPVIVDGIRMWSMADIAASKVNAISRRVTKKDFWDIDRLLDVYSISEIAESYRKSIFLYWLLVLHK